MVKRWLHPAWLSWRVDSDKINVGPVAPSARELALLDHVEFLLASGDPTRDVRADAITNLRKCLDLRVRGICEDYRLSEVPIRDKPSGRLELLEYFGLVKPLMAQRLVDLRNAVEHEDEEPPELSRIEEVQEFIWYFLRSTDAALRVRPFGLCFNSAFAKKPGLGTRPPYILEVICDPTTEPPWNPVLVGFVQADALADEPQDDWVALDVLWEQSEEERAESDDKRHAWESLRQTSGDPTVYIEAKVRGPSSAIKILVARYLSYS